jgi:hypothetical protein
MDDSAWQIEIARFANAVRAIVSGRQHQRHCCDRRDWLSPKKKALGIMVPVFSSIVKHTMTISFVIAAPAGPSGRISTPTSS